MMDALNIAVLVGIAIMGPILAHDMKSYVERFSRFLLVHASKKLNEDYADELLEEWLSHLNDTEEVTGKLFHAISIYLYGAQCIIKEIEGVRSGYAGKRLIDFGLTLICVPPLIIVVLPIALLLWLSGGKIIELQKQAGANGKPFDCYRFFTGDVKGNMSNLGAFLKYTSLNEIPQLWNVLKGDMSLVGPRAVPHVKRDSSILYFGQKPGITGQWQVMASDPKENNDPLSEMWLANQKYSQNVSIRSDIGILTATVRVVLMDKARNEPDD